MLCTQCFDLLEVSLNWIQMLKVNFIINAFLKSKYLGHIHLDGDTLLEQIDESYNF